MNRGAWIITKVNLKNISAVYITTTLLVLALTAQYIIDFIASLNGDDLSMNVSISCGWVVWLLIPLAAVLISAKNFKRIINLGGKRADFFRGSLMTYAALALTAAAAATVLNYALDRPVVAALGLGGKLSAADVFGWSAHNPVIAFFQQSAFLFLFAAFTHTLTALQDRWYGLAVDVLIIAVIAVFTPIAPLRRVLAGFFWLILFSPPLPQIAACVVLALAVYGLNIPILARKVI
jgi:hypothetical protein